LLQDNIPVIMITSDAKATKGKAPQGPNNGSPVPTGNSNSVQSDMSEPPQWAKQLLAEIGNLNSRVGLIEAGASRPGYTTVASTSKGSGGVKLPQPVIQAPIGPAGQSVVPMVPAQRALQPQMGESGSGYTRLPNGKMVRNKRPAHRPLVVRQAKNWRSTATTNLVKFLKERNIGHSNIKPVNEPVYQDLILQLAMAKDYQSYVKNGGTDEVHVWRTLHESSYSWNDQMAEGSGNWADDVASASEVDSHSGINVEDTSTQPAQ